MEQIYALFSRHANICSKIYDFRPILIFFDKIEGGMFKSNTA